VDWAKLTPTKYDSATSDNLNQMIRGVRNVYNDRRNKAFKIKEHVNDSLIKEITRDGYFQIKQAYTNDKIIDIVQKPLAIPAVLEVGNKLIRKTTPIYATPEEPDNPLNFRTFFYAPQKYFAGIYYDTFWFNVVIMWFMVFVAIVVLYLDLLKKFLKLFDKIGDYKLRKKLSKN